jgi:hypothetical protein
MALDRDGGEVLDRRATADHVLACHVGVCAHERRLIALAVRTTEAFDVPPGLEDRERPRPVGVGELLGAERERDVGGAGLNRVERKVRRGRARRAGVLAVDHRLALQPRSVEHDLPTDHLLSREQAFGGVGEVDRVDLVGAAAGVGQRAGHGLGGQHAQALVGELAERRHVRAGDVDVFHWVS